MLVTVAALVVAAPLQAQAVHVEVSAGVVAPTGPTNGNVSTGGQLGIGLSHQLASTPLSVGVEGSFVIFGENLLTYAQSYPTYPPCAFPGCTEPVRVGNAGHLDLANYFVTAKYQFVSVPAHPYVGVAGGITQKWGSTTYNGTVHGGALNGGGRVSAGIESQLGRLGVGLDVSYAMVSSLTYDGNPVRYVPVTLRLSF